MSILFCDSRYTDWQKARSILNEKYTLLRSEGDTLVYKVPNQSFERLKPVNQARASKSISLEYDEPNKIITVTKLK